MDLMIVASIYFIYRYLAVLFPESTRLLTFVALVLTLLVIIGYTTLGFRPHN